MKAIEIVISLAAIYLLYSLMATIFQELIAQFLSLRARMLVKAIAKMLDKVEPSLVPILTGTSKPSNGPINELIKQLWSRVKKSFIRNWQPLNGRAMTEKFYAEPSIKFLGSSNWYSKPSYMSAENFSTTLLNMLRGEGYDGKQSQILLIKDRLDKKGWPDLNLLFDDDTLKLLKALLADSHDDIEKFRAGVEQWFNETMERTSGWYKRNSQKILLVIGIGIAIIFNVDTIEIANKISKDDKLREQMVQYASSLSNSLNADSTEFHNNFGAYVGINGSEKNAKAPANIDTAKGGQASVPANTKMDSINVKYELLKLIYRQTDSINSMLGLGWITKDTNIAVKDGQTRHTNSGVCKYTVPQKSKAKALLGWLLTALAISLGSPFWFDLLNKMVKLRGSGVIPGGDTAAQNPTPDKATTPKQRKG